MEYAECYISLPHKPLKVVCLKGSREANVAESADRSITTFCFRPGSSEPLVPLSRVHQNIELA